MNITRVYPCPQDYETPSGRPTSRQLQSGEISVKNEVPT